MDKYLLIVGLFLSACLASFGLDYKPTADGITEATGDARYFQNTGGEISGDTEINGTLDVSGNVTVSKSSAILEVNAIAGNAQLNLTADKGADWALLGRSDSIFTLQEIAVGNHLNVLPGGNVGIGTSTQTHKLEVAGTLQAEDTTINGTLEVVGNVTATGYVQDKSCRAFAYLTAPSNTTITTADNWYPVEGVFTNVVLEGFATTTVGGKPAIVYTNGYEGRFIVRIQAGVRAPASTTVGITLKINDTVQNASGVPSYVFCRFDDQPYQISNFGIPVITNGTTIQLMTTSDDDGDVLTFDQFKVKTERWR